MMNKKRWIPMLPAFTVGAVLMGFAAPQASAQMHDQQAEKRAFKQHERQEREMYGKRAVRAHQKQERREFQMEERAERSGSYNNGYGNWGYGQQPYRRGQFHNRVYGQGQYGGYSQYYPYGQYPSSSQYPTYRHNHHH